MTAGLVPKRVPLLARVSAVGNRHRDGRLSFAMALAAAAGYYAGAKLGLALTFSPNPISVLWPPNSILLAALLLAPARSWWLILAAVFPAHLLAELQGGVPLAMVLCWYLSNVSEALIGAVCVRQLLRRRPPFDSVRDVGIFLLFAVFLGPFLSSFLDAAFVTLIGWGASDYWQLWRTRFFSNVLATLIIVPVVVTWAGSSIRSLASAAPRRVLEGGVLACGLVLVCVLVFDAHQSTMGAVPALLYLPLPFLVWSALRFGPRGSSAAFMAVALLVIWGAGHERGPFVSGAPMDNALAVQVFLTFFGAILLALAAGVQERRDSEARLRRNEERFQLVLRATNDVIYDWDIAADDLWWNHNGEAYFGEMSGSRPHNFETWAALLHPEDRDRVTARLQALIHGGGQTCNAEYRLRRADGAYVHVNARGFIIRDETGKPLRLIGSLMDVSDRKHVEEANQRLAHVSRLAMVGELSASIAHEINQPLGAILSNADAAEILLSKETIPVEELRQIIDDIRHDDMRAGEVIRHMRSLLRRRELAMQPFDLNRAIADVLNFAGADLGRHGVRVDTEFTLLPIVHGDQVHLQQVVLNLILNAVDAMEAVPVSRRRLDIRTARSETGGVEITISDTGIGISPEAAAHLFDSFYTTKPEGMGLGLSIARSIIEAHRGTIRVEPRAGEGACLKVCLPVQPDKAEGGLRALAGGRAV